MREGEREGVRVRVRESGMWSEAYIKEEKQRAMKAAAAAVIVSAAPAAPRGQRRGSRAAPARYVDRVHRRQWCFFASGPLPAAEDGPSPSAET